MPGGQELALLAAAAAIAFVLLEAMIRRTFVATVVLLVVTAVHTALDYIPVFYLGGTNVGHWDVVAVLLLSAAIARLLRRPELSGLQWLLIAFGLVALLSATLGASEFGINAAFNDFRKFFFFVSVALYFSTVAPDAELLDRIGRAWMALASAFVLLALLRWAVLPLGLTGDLFGSGHYRVLVASTTLFLLQAFVIGAVAWSGGRSSPWTRRLTPVLLAAVVLMQHRTVWVALLAVVAVMAVLDPGMRRRLVPMMALSLVAIVALNFTLLGDESTDLQEQLAESAAQRATWEWRVAGWQALLDYSGPRNAAERLVGRPFGTGWERMLDGRVSTVSPHNFYVETYLRLGLLGLGALILLYSLVLWRLLTARGGMLHARVLLLLLGTHTIYFVPYSPDPVQGLLLGFAISTASVTASHHRYAPVQVVGTAARAGK